MFDPQTEYEVSFEPIPIRDFHEFKEEFVVRPPYQRKSVWSRKKQQALLDSLFRRYYVPRIVIRLVRLDSDRTVKEVIDGQQRIHTAQLFLDGQLKLPDSLGDLHADLPGRTFTDLPAELRRFVDRSLKYDADIVKGIDNPRDPEHQRIASEIFWRLQQGESLNYMEIAHARLSSLSRNFAVKYADDITFDYEAYKPVDENPHKHRFFNVIDRKNDRMQHLALMIRLLILEENNGPADIKDLDLMAYVEKYQQDDGIGNLSFENLPQAKAVLSALTLFADVFQDDPMFDEDGNGSVRELRTEYFIISAFLLLRHLRKHYVFAEQEQALFREFLIDFHERWKTKKEEDRDIVLFSDSRQQSAAEIENRHRIIRQAFFDYAKEHDVAILTKDDRRAFSEAERIAIYRRDNGLCQMCLQEGKPEKECRVPWSQYDADHVVPHSKGGPTTVENAHVLCAHHNRTKSNR
jgi:hypothetical protein